MKISGGKATPMTNTPKNNRGSIKSGKVERRKSKIRSKCANEPKQAGSSDNKLNR